MKKYISLVVVFFLSIFGLCGQISQTVRFQLSDVQVSLDSDGYSHVYIEDTYSAYDAGKPDLPVFYQSFVLPSDAELTGIDITTMNRQRLAGSHRVFPAQPPVPTNIPVDEIGFTPPDPAIYTSGNAFPGKQVEVVSDQLEMGYHVVTVKICPWEYFPQREELFLCGFDFILRYQEKTLPQALRSQTSVAPLRQEKVRRIIQNRVENKTDVDRFQNVSGIQRSAMTDSNREHVKIPDYIIITNEALYDTFLPLAEWKTKKGINTLLKTVESIEKEYPGCDLQEKIRNYLIHVHSVWGDGMFVLLGGHTNIIPARKILGDQQKDYRPSDLYYATVQGTWNANKNHLFGEPDDLNDNLSPAFYLGRAPVKNPGEAQVFINKVLSYEKALNVPNPNYFNNILMSDAFVGGPPQFPQLCLIDGRLLTLLSDYLKRYSSPAKTYLMIDNHDCSDTTTPMSYSYDCESYHGDEELTRNNFLNALNNRGNFQYGNFHIIYHMDHSNAVGLGTSSKYKGEDITKKDARELTNNHYWQILMSGGCEPATFNVDCFAKEYLNNPAGGGVAFIGNADVGWSGEVWQFDRFMKFLYNPSNNTGHSLGYAFQRATEGNSQRRRLTLLGDPEMPVWTATPKTLTVIRSLSRVAATGEYNVTVRVSNLPAGQEALLCFQKDDEIYSRYIVSDNQSHVYTVNPQTSGTMHVTVTAHNFKPYELILPVTGSTHLKVTHLVIDNKISEYPEGHLEAGKLSEMYINVYNSGNTSLPQSNFPCVLTCSSPYVRISNPESRFYSLPVSMDGINYVPFEIQVDKNIPDSILRRNEPLEFELKITGNNRTYSVPFRVDVLAPRIESGNKQIVSTNTSGGYTTFNFTADLFNAGDGIARGLKAKLKARSTYATVITTGVFTYPDIAPKQTSGNSSPANYSVRVSSAYASSPVLLTLEVENGAGRKWSFDFDLNSRPAVVDIGSVQSVGYIEEIELYWNPLPDVSGYNIYRSDVSSEGVVAGNFAKANAFPVTMGYYKDMGLNPLSKYAYKISAVNSEGNETAWTGHVLAWTSLPPMDLFPVVMETEGDKDAARRNKSSIIVCDVNDDSKPEIFTAIDKGDSGEYGLLVALKDDGTDLFDIDKNVTTHSGFALFNQSIQAPVAVGDLFGNGEYQVVSVTRNFANVTNFLTCHSTRDRDNDNKPDLLWQVQVNKRYGRGPILANIDNSPDNSLEIIICNMEAGVQNNVIRIYNNQGRLLSTFGNGEGYSALAVADLDGDGDMEIVAGFSSGVHIWHHDGTPFSVNPFFTESGYLFDSTPVICDLNGDGKKDIVISARSGSQRQVFALDLNRNKLSGWGSNQKVPFGNDIAISHRIAVGDLDNSGSLRVVALGNNCLKIWNKSGTLAREIPLLDVNNPSKINPILADIDGDNKCEIIFGYKNMVYAYKFNGKQAEGFPLQVEEGIREILGSIAVADVAATGKNNIIAAIEDKIYMWRTHGNADVIEWGSERKDSHNRGEYPCRETVITSSVLWRGTKNLCGDIRVKSGIFTLYTSCTLHMHANSQITVEAGARLEVLGKIYRAKICALPGSKVTLSGESYMQLSRNGSLEIQPGAELEITSGEIDVTDSFTHGTSQ